MEPNVNAYNSDSGGVLAVIPARGGSKEIPKKNIKLLNGKPLIYWSIKQALLSRSVSRVVVSTDDPEIAEIALEYGADVPFMRPSELSCDESSSYSVVTHALSEVTGYQGVLLLQPTSPLRTVGHIDELLKFAKDNDADSVVSVSEVKQHPFLMHYMNESNRLKRVVPLGENSEQILRRQNLPRVFMLNGAMYYGKSRWILESGSLCGDGSLGYEMDEICSLDIDSVSDWELAENLIMDVM